jgi:hypothetical protein
MATRTARNVIEDAFHRMGFISEDEGLTAEQTDRALTLLNDMMNGWEAEGIQYTHTDLGLDDVVNVPDFLVRSAVWMLIDDIADEYGKALTDRQQMQVARARTNLQGYYFRIPQAQTDEGIRNRRGPYTSSILRLDS